MNAPSGELTENPHPREGHGVIMADADIPGKILVVDDEPVNLMVLKGVLGKSGYHVECASSGEQCLELARSSQPDMILLDVMMPGESGFDTCRKLKHDPATSHLPVMFITGLGEMSEKLEGLGIGAVDYITKPFMAAEVLARVKAQMAFQARQREVIDGQASRLAQVQQAQRALLPRPEDLPDSRFAVQFLTVLEAGGDFYDVLDTGSGRTVYFLADVSGHDLSASFLTPSLKALFRQHAISSATPADVLSRMNTTLCAITSEEVYMTAVCLLVDRSAGHYMLASAGHPPAMAVQNGLVASIRVSSPPLGLFLDADFGNCSARAQSGDRFYLYTDGLAENAGRYVTSDSFHDTLAELCLQNVLFPLRDAVGNMVRGMTTEAKPQDDIVLLGVEV
ncbi:Response regulator receiver domain-containing protein [Humidesulfovibrio mexicanus]|uniref:Response regulator receiver domain-containing protein n=1 Tax=Humidesulfovibrio mexicanus TaxID=147047 RepID=A0A238XNN1_9BACT|nr:SpoIIE family protein phosphatase [Humidesulfovibrio mexicanus]SNR59964.1 Response regulator receiver domain-containing protein [Humidesulfovibrio mexicanus]